MEKINKGIVFSNDIERILKGNNALNFNYNDAGILIPSSNLFENLREDFKESVNKIFPNSVTILSEEEMLASTEYALKDVLGRYPHCIFRQHLFIKK